MSQHAHWSSELRWRVRPNVLPRQWPWSTLLAFGVASVGALIVAMLLSEKPFYNDSSGYWLLGLSFTVNGHFSLLNFSDPQRGYVLPLINYGLQTLIADFAWTASSMVKIFNALTFALIGTVLGPAFVQTVWPEQPRWGIARRLALSALLLVFWSGFLNFPLSDFPGLAVGLLTLIAVARTDSPGWMLVAGLALGVTIDIRAAYTPLMLAVVALVAWTWYEQRGTRHASAGHRMLCAALLVIGFAAISLPQSLSTHRYHGSWSFIPDATVLEPASMYYTSGMAIEDIDTYIGAGGDQSTAVNYDYPPGKRLLEEQKEEKVTSTSQYLGLFVSHPLVMSGLLIGHIVNGLDPKHTTPYVENLHSGWDGEGRVASFLLMFIALLRVLWPAARRQLGPGRLRYLVALSLCCVTTLPGGGERRYLLPVYLIGYALALTPSWPNPIGAVGSAWRRFRVPAIIAVTFLAYASVVWHVTNDATDNTSFGPRDPPSVTVP